jgi:hypothetical protein
MLMALVQSVIRRLPNYLSCMEEPMAGHVGIKGICEKLENGNTKGSRMGLRWMLEDERAYFCSLGAFKTYDNLWEGENQVIAIK